ncbi:aprataxin [Plodia interpunctella]|uniref:aprataxin n=1 Tax=Plodia interpunctella TaxID=58824 RepID=UPI002367E285|nr:aprataxin [Plodia interpunctella]
MSKRKLGIMTGIGTTKQPRHWSLGLLGSMEDPESIVKKTDRVVAIRDKYPKAKIHYLILPFEDINSIHKLNDTHVGLLEEFGKLYQELKEEHMDSSLRAGFHAVPSMQRLHMHVISTDMVSPCLKTKVHWNSFTTNFFIPYQDALKELKESGSIKKISSELHKSLMATDLVCNQCDFKPKNMPQLKEHLLTHIK